jgi:sugar/nucleoside kinase (ribokinase family)
MFDVLSIGGVSRDVFYKTSEASVLEKDGIDYLSFPFDTKIIPEEAHFFYGGGALNTAVNFSNLGLKTAILASVGKEGTGNVILAELERKKIFSKLMYRESNNHTALSFIVSNKKDHVVFTYRGANDDLKINNWKLLKKADWFYIASLSGNSHNLMPEIFTFAKINKIKIAWNPGSRQLKEGYPKIADFLNQTNILFLNKGEAQFLVQSAGINDDLDDEKVLLTHLKSFGPSVVVVTCGKDGAYGCDGFMEYYQKSFPATVADTTGAGDCFSSTFTACTIYGLDVRESLEKAALNAAAVVSEWGSTNGLLEKKKLFEKKKETVSNA